MSPGGRAKATEALARLYDAETKAYLTAGIGIYVWYLLGEDEETHAGRLFEFAGLRGWLDHKTVCELGCGVGELLRLMRLSFPDNQYVGITNSQRQVAAMSDRAPFVRGILGDFNDLAFPTDVDLMISCESLGHVEALDLFLFRCAQALRPGGRMLIQDLLPSPGVQDIPSWSYRLRSIGEVVQAGAAAGLELIRLQLPNASTARSKSYAQASEYVRRVHAPIERASDGCVLFLFGRFKQTRAESPPADRSERRP